jgi:hypothetical protein
MVSRFERESKRAFKASESLCKVGSRVWKRVRSRGRVGSSKKGERAVRDSSRTPWTMSNSVSLKAS